VIWRGGERGEWMGRVFDALRRASATDDSGVPKRQHQIQSAAAEVPMFRDCLPPARLKRSYSAVLQFCPSRVRRRAVSASSAHTADVPDGSALPGGIASRDAGATLDAAGAARVGGFASYDIPSRASSLTSSLLVNLVLLTVNSFVRCAQEFCKPVSACRCVHL